MIGLIIKQYLVENGIKQSFIAEKCGFTNSVVSDICMGNRKVDCIEYYLICKALNLPLEYFFNKMEEANKDGE